jgi:hypothetical protein
VNSSFSEAPGNSSGQGFARFEKSIDTGLSRKYYIENDCQTLISSGSGISLEIFE